MKTTKWLLLLACLMASTVSFAQLKVNSEGRVSIEEDESTDEAKLVVTASPYLYDDFVNNVGIVSFAQFPSSQYGYSSSIGISALAGRAVSGRNFGLFGNLLGSQAGAAVYGVADGNIDAPNGKYAGLFNGNTLVNGTLTATTIVSPSDIRLKKNVSQLEENGENSALDNLMSMNVIKYNYEEQVVSKEDLLLSESLFGKDITEEMLNLRNENEIKRVEKLHFGLSAQELQTIYPSLVEEGQDGYLAVNYIELVPVLIRSIQELKEELDEVRGSGTVRKASTKQTSTVGKAEMAQQNVLYQNTPNPFKESTTIRFTLTDDARNAAICIFDMQGKLLKKTPVSTGMESISVNGYELGEGMFLYTLLVNGQEIDTKRMILTK